MRNLYQSLAHSKWDCKYHVVFVPKRGRKVIFGRYANSWEQFSMPWRNRKNARSWKGT